jgi:hypothetical protein
MTHPYASKPDHCFWRRGISVLEPADVDPVVAARFTVRPGDKVATAGSCFAQHIARHLKGAGFNYYVAEELNPLIGAHTARDYNYGTFSARYGNVYTARQFCQLLERAYGLFQPTDDVWHAKDGCLIDPYRPQIQPDGFRSEREYRLDREKHFAAVRSIVETSDVFVFTLGLTEAWMNNRDGAVYPVCPGVAGGTFDPAVHEFVNFRVSEVLTDMRIALNFIRKRNPKIKFILTVSPVALLATAEDRHVLVSTTYSKSVLRAVCGELEADDEDVAYFPSYEIITGSFSRGAYFAADARDVTESGVRHVMRLFMQHYAEHASQQGVPPAVGNRKKSRKIARQIDELTKVVCDEEALDAG